MFEALDQKAVGKVLGLLVLLVAVGVNMLNIWQVLGWTEKGQARGFSF